MSRAEQTDRCAMRAASWRRHRSPWNWCVPLATSARRSETCFDDRRSERRSRARWSRSSSVGQSYSTTRLALKRRCFGWSTRFSICRSRPKRWWPSVIDREGKHLPNHRDTNRREGSQARRQSARAVLLRDSSRGGPSRRNSPSHQWNAGRPHPSSRRVQPEGRGCIPPRTPTGIRLTKRTGLGKVSTRCSGSSRSGFATSTRRATPSSPRCFAAARTAKTVTSVARAVGDGLSHGGVSGRGEWSHGESNRDQESAPDATEPIENPDETSVPIESDEHSDDPETSQENPPTPRKTGPGPVDNGKE